MSGATCAIFMMTFNLPDEYKRVQSPRSDLKTGFNKCLLGDKKILRSPGTLGGQPEAPRFSVTRRETWQFCRSERERVLYLF